MTETTAGPARALPPQFGPKPGHLRLAEVKRQIEALTARLVARAQGLGIQFQQGSLREMTRIDSTLFDQLIGGAELAVEDADRLMAARVIAEELLDVGEKDSPAFWATDLGRALAREIGYVQPWVPHGVAEAVLQVSRQAIDQMASKGRLDMEGRAITRASLQHAALERWPREADR